MPEQLHVLFYEYVPDVVERRDPYREGHLGLIRSWYEEGRIVREARVAGAALTGVRIKCSSPSRSRLQSEPQRLQARMAPRA